MDPTSLSGNLTSLAGRYAKTLYDLASESRDVANVAKQFQEFCHFTKANTDFHAIIFSPALTREEHIAVFQALCDKVKLSSILSSFIRILAENRRLKYIFAIQSIFQELVDCSQNIIHAEIVSAVPLTSKQKEAVSQILAKQFSGSVEIRYATDQTYLGGILVHIGNQIIDLTIANQLNHLANAMKGSA